MGETPVLASEVKKGKNSPIKNRDYSKGRTAVLFALPALIPLFVFWVWPMV